jgi:hypothetical protein
VGVPGKASQASPNWFQSYCFDLYPQPSVLSGSKVERLTLPEPCEYDILLVCQHPHALSRDRLVPALAGRTIAA